MSISVRTASILTMASQNHPVLLVQVLLDKLAALLEDPFAVRVFPEGLLRELMAGHALRDVSHAVLTTCLKMTIRPGCRETQHMHVNVRALKQTLAIEFELQL